MVRRSRLLKGGKNAFIKRRFKVVAKLVAARGRGRHLIFTPTGSQWRWSLSVKREGREIRGKNLASLYESNLLSVYFERTNYLHLRRSPHPLSLIDRAIIIAWQLE